ncbi:hypothetical protein Tco_1427949 [Tanacetum coccineum]
MVYVACRFLKSQSTRWQSFRWQRDCALVDGFKNSRSLCQIQVQGTSSIQEVNDHYNIFTRESQEYELKTKDKAYWEFYRVVSEPEDVVEIEDMVESEDETVPASVHEVGKSSTAISFERTVMTAHALVEKKGKAKDEYYSKLILDLGNEVQSSLEQGTTVMENLVRNLNELVERDLYWTRVLDHEFYQEMIRRGFVFEERPNEAIDVPVEDEKSPSSEPRGSPHDS